MSNIIEFPKISVLKITNVTYDDKSTKQVYKESQEMLLAEWVERNNIISDEFHTMSVWQKQQTLDTILEMNGSLYGLVLELKDKIKQKEIEE